MTVCNVTCIECGLTIESCSCAEVQMAVVRAVLRIQLGDAYSELAEVSDETLRAMIEDGSMRLVEREGGFVFVPGKRKRKHGRFRK